MSRHALALESIIQRQRKGKEAVAVKQETKQPLRLLDLRVDIPKDFVNQVRCTND